MVDFRDLANRKAMVLHEPTGVVGRVVHFYDGVVEKSVSTVNDKPVDGEVFELDQGHRFMAKAEDVVELSLDEQRCLTAYQTLISHTVSEMINLSKGANVEVPKACVLLRAVLRQEMKHVTMFERGLRGSSG